jgi:two-component system, LytTR family, sensor kinase
LSNGTGIGMALPAVNPKDNERTRFRLRHPVRAWAVTALVTTFIGIVFVVRYYFVLALNGGEQVTLPTIAWSLVGWWIWIVLTPIVFFLAQRFPVERPLAMKSLAVHFAGWIGISLLDVTLYSVLEGIAAIWTNKTDFGFWTTFQHVLVSSIAVDLLVYAGVVAVVHALEYRQRYLDREIAASQLEMQLARAQFSTLEMQLQPHFLFNTLNTISALMDDNVEASRRVLTLLSDLLRSTLRAGGQHDVPLRQELTFTERYLEIQQIRFKDQLEIAFDIDPEALNGRVPTLILQPVVENVFKHGLAPGRQTSRIVIRAFKDGEMLQLEVLDNGPGLQWKDMYPVLKKGVGLRNIEERLFRLYGAKASLNFEEAPGGGLKVIIKLSYCETETYPGVEAGSPA